MALLAHSCACAAQDDEHSTLRGLMSPSYAVVLDANIINPGVYYGTGNDNGDWVVATSAANKACKRVSVALRAHKAYIDETAPNPAKPFEFIYNTGPGPATSNAKFRPKWNDDYSINSSTPMSIALLCIRAPHVLPYPRTTKSQLQQQAGGGAAGVTATTVMPSDDGPSQNGADDTIANDDTIRRRTTTPTLALLNARRIVGLSQLCCAANLACQRPTSPTWDTVFLVAASTHLGHVLRDYAFVRNDDEEDHNATMGTNGNNGNEEEQEYMVIVFMISNRGLELYQSLLEQHGLSDTMMDLEDYLQRQRETSAYEFQSWYKLTAQELASSSLEACVLTKIATKMA